MDVITLLEGLNSFKRSRNTIIWLSGQWSSLKNKIDLRKNTTSFPLEGIEEYVLTYKAQF